MGVPPNHPKYSNFMQFRMETIGNPRFWGSPILRNLQLPAGSQVWTVLRVGVCRRNVAHRHGCDLDATRTSCSKIGMDWGDWGDWGRVILAFRARNHLVTRWSKWRMWERDQLKSKKNRLLDMYSEYLASRQPLATSLLAINEMPQEACSVLGGTNRNTGQFADHCHQLPLETAKAQMLYLLAEVLLASVTLWLCQNSYWKWPFMVDFPIKNGDFP